jgi:hypothetical protein
MFVVFSVDASPGAISTPSEIQAPTITSVCVTGAVGESLVLLEQAENINVTAISTAAKRERFIVTSHFDLILFN